MAVIVDHRFIAKRLGLNPRPSGSEGPRANSDMGQAVLGDFKRRRWDERWRWGQRWRNDRAGPSRGGSTKRNELSSVEIHSLSCAQNRLGRNRNFDFLLDLLGAARHLPFTKCTPRGDFEMTEPTKIDRRQVLALGVGAAAVASQAACAQTAAGAGGADEPDLSGKSILVTGASSGFGRLGVEYYARLGAKVFATMRNVPRAEAEELKDLAASESLDLSVIEIDVTSDEQVEAGVAEALASNDGQLDVLVNNAGISVGGPIEVQDMEATSLLFDTNVYGCQRMARAALPAMRAKGGGHIFNISSQLGRVIIPGFGLYSASKFALEAMSEQMAYELVPHGVDVTIIQPGGYPTMIWSNNNKNSGPLKDRTSEDLLAAYPALTAGMGERTGGGSTDPMDIPRNIAEIIAMPKGTAPLRRAVHPIARPQEAINDVSKQTQLAMLGESQLGPWVKDVLER